MSDFFPDGHCRHYQLVDGWAKVYCVRTEPDHEQHETERGFRWNSEPSDLESTS